MLYFTKMEDNNSGRNVSVDFFRFFFITIICLWHFSNKIRIFYHGYLGVEFFFILSGMFLYHTYCSHPDLNPLDYSLKRFTKFFPKYIVCLLPIFFIVNYKWIKEINIESVTDIVLRFISEGFMLQGFGLFPSGSNYPMWFLSVLIISGGIIFSFLKVDRRKALGVFFPLFAILTYMYIFSDGKRCIERWGYPNWFYIPFLRGMADICLGVMLMAVISYKRTFLEKNTKTLDIISCLSLFLLILITVIEPSHDQYSLLFIPFILTGCFLKKSLFNRIFTHSIWIKLGNISYEMFLVHAFIIKIYSHTIMPMISSATLIIIVYLTLVISVAYIINIIFAAVSSR